MTQVRRTITIELEVDLVGTYVPREEASLDCPATYPDLVDLQVTGIRSSGPQFCRTLYGRKVITNDILHGSDSESEAVSVVLTNLAALVEPTVKPVMMGDAFWGINCD
jgi:hypothetical protein